MIALELKRNSQSDKGWVYYGDEIKYTSNRKLIVEELNRILKKRIWLELCYPGYKSNPALIISLSKKGVEVELPPGWDSSVDTALLKYRLPNEPWHSLKVHVKEITGHSIFFELPELHVVSERRACFRIDVPPDSRARVMIQKKLSSKRKRVRSRCITGSIKDISAGGMCMYPDMTSGLMLPEVHMVVGPVILDLKINHEKTWPTLEIQEAEVVRTSRTMLNDKNVMQMALKFRLTRKEEESLVAYIRHRELVVIRT